MKTKYTEGNEGWILDEDRALRDLLDDMYVSDDKEKRRRVGVWFGHPDKEVRDQRYPYITLDLVDFSEEMDRAERGTYIQPKDHNWSSGMDYGKHTLPDKAIGYYLHVPTPIRLTYQISSWARNPRHDRQILQNLFQRGLVPFQRGSLDVSDGTVRRLDVLNTAKRDTIEQDRRLLSNAVIVGVSSEVPWSQLQFVRDIINVRLRIVVDSSKGEVYSEEHWIASGEQPTDPNRPGILPR